MPPTSSEYHSDSEDGDSEDMHGELSDGDGSESQSSSNEEVDSGSDDNDDDAAYTIHHRHPLYQPHMWSQQGTNMLGRGPFDVNSIPERSPRYVIFCRISTEEQRKSGLGLQNQLSQLRQRAIDLSGKESAMILREIEETRSGGTGSIAVLSSLIEYAGKHKATLLIDNPTRLARTDQMKEVANALLKKHNVKLAWASDVDSTVSAIQHVLSVQERDQIIRRVNETLKRRKMEQRYSMGDLRRRTRTNVGVGIRKTLNTRFLKTYYEDRRLQDTILAEAAALEKKHGPGDYAFKVHEILKLDRRLAPIPPSKAGVRRVLLSGRMPPEPSRKAIRDFDKNVAIPAGKKADASTAKRQPQIEAERWIRLGRFILTGSNNYSKKGKPPSHEEKRKARAAYKEWAINLAKWLQSNTALLVPETPLATQEAAMPIDLSTLKRAVETDDERIQDSSVADAEFVIKPPKPKRRKVEKRDGSRPHVSPLHPLDEITPLDFKYAMKWAGIPKDEQSELRPYHLRKNVNKAL